MILPRAFLSIVTLIGAACTANAASAISEIETGTIAGASTVDTFGVFGPAGANLAGKTVSIYMHYVPSYFGPVENCRFSPCTYYVSQGQPSTPGATLISISIEGKRVTYTSSEYGEVLFDRSSSNFFYIYANTSDFGLGYRGVRVSTSFSAPVTFGSALSPGNSPVFGFNADNIEIFTPSDELPAETLTFLVNSG